MLYFDFLEKQGRSYKKWTGGARFKLGPFFYRKYEGDIKESNIVILC